MRLRTLPDLLRPTSDFDRLIHRTVSDRSRWRGKSARDGRFTLLTVDYHLTDHVLRLADSFRRHVQRDGPVVVVQNGSRGDNRRLRDADLTVAGFGLNVNHGPALDWGMRRVETEYTLICDPDTLVVSGRFRDELLTRLEHFGVAGMRQSPHPKHDYYHPMCTAFRTEIWKQGAWSFRPDWAVGESGDVGHALAAAAGGMHDGAVLRSTRSGLAGAVLEESFTTAVGMARIRDADADLDGIPIGHHSAWLAEWTAWVTRVAAGEDDVTGFPK